LYERDSGGSTASSAPMIRRMIRRVVLYLESAEFSATFWRLVTCAHRRRAMVRTAPRARAAFTPSHRFPTGVALSIVRRLELLAWARRYRAFIVEDDYTSEFRYSGPLLASLQGPDDTEQVIYIRMLNKALFLGLCIGYAVVPRTLLQAFVDGRYLIDRQPATGGCLRVHARGPFRCAHSSACASCIANSATRWPRR